MNESEQSRSLKLLGALHCMLLASISRGVSGVEAAEVIVPTPKGPSRLAMFYKR